MRPLRATPIHYLVTPAQLAGSEALDPNGAGARPPAAALPPFAAQSPPGPWTSLAPAREAAPATRPPLEGLAFCPAGLRLAATRPTGPGARELLLWHLLLPDDPTSTRLATRAPARAQLARCGRDALDVRLGAATLHWSMVAAPALCARRGAEDAAQGRFADWVAVHALCDKEVSEASGPALAPPIEHPDPLFAARPYGAWRAALLEVALLYEHPVEGGGTRRRVHKYLRSGFLGRALALWFYGDAVYWLTTADDSSAGSPGRTDLWRLTLSRLAGGIGGPEAHLGHLNCVGLGVELDPTGRFAALWTQGRATCHPYVLDCAAAKPRFWRLEAPRAADAGALAVPAPAPGGAEAAARTVAPWALAFAPEGGHLLCWSPQVLGATPVLYALPDRALKRPPNAQPFLAFAADHAGTYALGPHGRTLAHAPWQAGEAAAVVYDVVWPTEVASDAASDAAAAARARRRVATSSR